MANKILQLVVVFLFIVVFINWKNEGFGTSSLNTNNVHDIKTTNPHVTLTRPPSDRERFNFFARDADIVLRGRFVDVSKMSPTRENQSILAMRGEANRLALS